MAKSRGLADFRRKEYLRKLSGKFSNAVEAERWSAMVNASKPGEKPAPKPALFTLPQKTLELLKVTADSKCFKCQGTGIKGWRSGGTEAIICTCVKKRIETLQPALEEQQRRLEAKIVEEKAKQDEKLVADLQAAGVPNVVVVNPTKEE